MDDDEVVRLLKELENGNAALRERLSAERAKREASIERTGDELIARREACERELEHERHLLARAQLGWRRTKLESRRLAVGAAFGSFALTALVFPISSAFVLGVVPFLGWGFWRWSRRSRGVDA